MAGMNLAGSLTYILKNESVQNLSPPFMGLSHFLKSKKKKGIPFPRFRISSVISHETKQFDFKAYADQKAEYINNALDDVVSRNSHNPTNVHQSMRYSLLAVDKRLWPILCIAACEAVGGDQSTAIPAACAVEMIHTTSLIIDDLLCMHNGNLRRGKPSRMIYGEDVSILTAQALLACSFELLARARDVAPEKIVTAVIELTKAVGTEGLVGGQMLNLSYTKRNSNAELETSERVYTQKTAVLLEASVVLGAIFGGGTPAEVERLRIFAKRIGLPFQTVDDINVTKSTEELGFEKSREFAGTLYVEAKKQLPALDPAKAAPLMAFVDFIRHQMY